MLLSRPAFAGEVQTVREKRRRERFRFGLDAPLLWTSGIMVVGILVSPYAAIPVSRGAWAMGALLAVSALALALGRRKAGIVGLAAAFALGGVLVESGDRRERLSASSRLSPLSHGMEEGDAFRVEGVTRSHPVPTPDGEAWSATVETEAVWYGGERRELRVPVDLRVYGDWGAKQRWGRGDRVRFTAKITLPRGFRNVGNPSPVMYYWNRGVVCSGSCKSPDLLDVLSPGTPTLVDRVQERSERVMDGCVPAGRSREVLKALLFGRNLATPELRSIYVDAGIYHILVVSGFHLTLIAAALGFLLGAARVPRLPRCLLLLAVLCAYTDFTQWNVSVTRAFIVTAVHLAGRLLARDGLLANSTGAAAMVILSARPGFISDAGFLLTFASVLALATAAPVLANALSRPLALGVGALFSPRADVRDHPDHRRGRRVRYALERLYARRFHRFQKSSFARLIRAPALLWRWGVGAVVPGVSVLAFISPVLTGLYFPVSWEGVLSTAPAMLPVWPALMLLLAAVPLCLVSQSAAEWAFHAAAFLVDLLNRFGAAVAVRPLFTPPPPLWCTAAFFLALAWFLRPSRRRCGRAWAAAVAYALVTLNPSNAPSPRMKVTMLDVGEGDCFLVRFPGTAAVLVDTGGLRSFGGGAAARAGASDISRRVVIPHLLAAGVPRLDALVLTHFDTDHAGSAAGILRDFPVGLVACSRSEWERGSGLAGEVRAAAARAGVPVVPLSRGDERSWGGAGFEVLHPPAGYCDPKDNRNSLVFRLWGPGGSVLFTGDADSLVEAMILESGVPEPVAVLKCAHHGSRTSTGVGFLRAVRPAVALVSCGPPYVYSHPSPAVTRRLDGEGVRWFTTHAMGQVDAEFRLSGVFPSFPANSR